MRGLPAAWYCDSAHCAVDRERVLRPSWQFVCHESDLPATGTAVRFDFARQSAVVLRTSSGSLNAFLNACRHRGARLVDGDAHTGLAFCVGARLRCAYHGWTYDENGSLEAIPAGQTYGAFDRSAHGLVPLQVASWRGLVFAAFGQPAHSLAEQLAPATDWPDLGSWHRLREPSTRAMHADWKLVCEHLLDVSHWTTVRPAPKPKLFDATALCVAGPHLLRSRSHPTGVSSSSPWSVRAYHRLLSEATAPGRAESLYLWPNTLLRLTADGLTVEQVLPGEPRESVLRQSRYGIPGPDRNLRRLRYAHERILRQVFEVDRRLVERTQHGLGAVDPGWSAGIAEEEVGLRWFVERCRAELAPDEPPGARRKPGPRKPRRARVAAGA